MGTGRQIQRCKETRNMKYVLIVENDDTCYLCPLCEVEFGWLGDIKKGVCRRTYDDVTVYLDGVSGRPKWCPLKPMPVAEFPFEYEDDFRKGYVVGRNQVIEELEK